MGKKKIADNLLPFFSLIDNEIVKEHYLKKLSAELDTSLDNLKIELDKTAKKETTASTFISKAKDKRSRKEVIEEYLLALLIQLDDRKEAIKKTSEILSDYSFEILAYQKIFGALKTFALSEKSIETGELIKSLPQETVPVFDKCYLMPIPKFENNEKYIEEILKVASEAKTLFVKERIKEVSQALNKRQKDGLNIVDLQKELITLVDTMGQLSSASKN